MYIKLLKKDAIKSMLNKALHTWILETVFGSRNDFIVLHSILKPWPALIIYIRHSVCNSIQNALGVVNLGQDKHSAKKEVYFFLLNFSKIINGNILWFFFSKSWNKTCHSGSLTALPTSG
jgi:hypothetical protein